MNLPQRLLNWPQTVARQVHAALFLPAHDMHPSQFEQCIPSSLQGISPASLSQALRGKEQDWARVFDGRQRLHRLALLPRDVIERLCWNLGVVTYAVELRKIVLREDLEFLAQHGMDEAAWALVFQDPAFSTDAHVLAPNSLDQWPDLMRRTGEQGLAAIAKALPPSLRQRLLWKLPAASCEDASAPNAALLTLAYEATVPRWSADWDDCLSQSPLVH